MPAAADIALVARLLQHHGDLRMTRNGREETIDIDRAESPRRRQLIIGGQRLAVEKHHAVCRLCIGDGLHLFIGHGLQFDAVDLRAQSLSKGLICISASSKQ